MRGEARNLEKCRKFVSIYNFQPVRYPAYSFFKLFSIPIFDNDIEGDGEIWWVENIGWFRIVSVTSTCSTFLEFERSNARAGKPDDNLPRNTYTTPWFSNDLVFLGVTRVAICTNDDVKKKKRALLGETFHSNFIRRTNFLAAMTKHDPFLFPFNY